ncbi:glycosyltransferase [Paenibacillus sp. FSL R7-269]|uniref:glycosyltransferase n=1 Tax=Paenibacillus sp. FSL R7-269 TaxID=1226755 RepID=UPI00056CA268|nr:glycosyltransferase [Paenibacillus sp. FSL R7-269]
MKILFLINVPLPEASLLMNEKPSPFGGWLINVANNLSSLPNVELTIAFPKLKVKEYIKIQGKDILYYAFEPVKEKNKKKMNFNPTFEKIIDEVKPDILHIHGTELAHTLSFINVSINKNIRTIISIQGLVSVIAKHIFSNLPFRVIFGATLRNILRKDNVYGLYKLYLKRGKNEIEALKKVNYIIGRTTWDKACTSQINPNAMYYMCNETVREQFYNYQWNKKQCEKHSIFLSQAHYPIKGLHYVLEAMPLILKRFSDAKLYISGKNITQADMIMEKLQLTYYGKYIKKIIKRNNLERSVFFTGLLNEEEMCERYLKSNVFVCPSAIENSPNSLGEAMLLGVPSVASDVGGVSDMLTHKKEGFIYQADAPYMLAHYICEIFANDEIASLFSERSRKRAWNTHNREKNISMLQEIYNSILLRGNET